jgi:protoheme IX farnesyltransferase
MLKTLAIFADLIKYKLSLAVVLSAVTGFFLYHNTLDYHLFILAVGIFFLASGAAALNQFTERVPDSLMERTKNRPIPSKNISEVMALSISSILIFLGCLLLFFNGLTPMILGISNLILYNLLYTYFKKRSIFSIIPGALVGALPPLIGFTSAGGTILNHEILCFSAFMFFWQLPHFWLIIIKYGKEYNAAGFATISNYLNESQIRYLVLLWVILSSWLIFLFYSISHTINSNILILLIILNISFIILFYMILVVKKRPNEIRVAFILINSFSLALMLFLIVSSILKP